MRGAFLVAHSDPNRVCVSKDGYEFLPSSDRWRISRDTTINIALIRDFLDRDLLQSFRGVLEFFAKNLSAKYTQGCLHRFKHFVQWAASAAGRVAEVSPQQLTNYRSTLSTACAWYVGVLASMFRQWDALGYRGLGDGLIVLLSEWRIGGNKKGEAIRLRSPLTGALTDLEFEALHNRLVELYERREISLAEFNLVNLASFSGRRPAQISDLVSDDLVRSLTNDGFAEYILNVPRRKQRGLGFRSNFRPYALTQENGLALDALVNENAERLTVDFGCAHGVSLATLPLFPDWRALKGFVGISARDRRTLPNDFLHRTANSLGTEITRVVDRLSVMSERTGSALRVSPIRFRRTTGTRAARAGYGPLMIAELLDHSDTQNASVYVENVPEHVDAINSAVARQLAPIAQAFVGHLVDSEGDAVRGHDPSSRIRTRTGEGAGTCGRMGYCGALAPVACYTCWNFQPWLDGPHDLVLASLVADNERIAKVTGDRQMAAINDRTILAITRVIQLCDARKKELGL